jgi:hypothetical protein
VGDRWGTNSAFALGCFSRQGGHRPNLAREEFIVHEKGAREEPNEILFALIVPAALVVVIVATKLGACGYVEIVGAKAAGAVRIEIHRGAVV